MSLTSCQTSFREGILDFLWRQWGQLGVSAPVAFEDAWCQDPEALLVFTLEAARQEPRMFDEVLDWLAEHGHSLMAHRFKALYVRDPNAPQALVEAALGRTVGAGRADAELVFPGFPVAPAEADPSFLRHGYLRPPFTRSGKSRSEPPETAVALAFKLRAGFGASARSEALRFLALRGGEASTSEVAEAALMTRYGLQQALEELAQARLVRRRLHGRRDLVWTMTAGDDGTSIADVPLLAWIKGPNDRLPTWVGWPSVFRGLALLWRWLLDARREGESAYLRSSGARAVMRQAAPLLRDQGLGWSPLEPSHFSGEAYWDAFVQDVGRLLAVLNPAATPTDGRRRCVLANVAFDPWPSTFWNPDDGWGLDLLAFEHEGETLALIRLPAPPGFASLTLPAAMDEAQARAWTHSVAELLSFLLAADVRVLAPETNPAAGPGPPSGWPPIAWQHPVSAGLPAGASPSAVFSGLLAAYLAAPAARELPAVLDCFRAAAAAPGPAAIALRLLALRKLLGRPALVEGVLAQGLPLNDQACEALARAEAALDDGSLITRHADREGYDLGVVVTASNACFLRALGYSGPVIDYSRARPASLHVSARL